MSAAVDSAREKRFEKLVTTTKAADLPEGQIWFVASAESEDRDGDVVRVKGGELGPLMRNPVFLWAHDANFPPIGKIVEIKIVGDELHALVEFDLEDDFAALIYSKYVRGFLSAVSIGFLAVAGGVKERDEGGFEFVEWEMIELSAVPVPSNRDALAFAREFAEYTADPRIQAWAKTLTGAEPAETNTMAKRKREATGKALELDDDNMAEMLELVDDKEARCASIREILESGDLTAAKRSRLQGMLSADSKANAFLGDVAVYGYTYNLSSPEAVAKAFGVAREAKAGRTLSAKNYRKLKTAYESIGEVLEQATDPDEDGDDKGAKVSGQKDVASALEELVEEASDDDTSRDDVLELLADAAGVEVSEVEEFIAGDSEPTEEQLAAMLDALDLEDDDEDADDEEDESEGEDGDAKSIDRSRVIYEFQ